MTQLRAGEFGAGDCGRDDGVGWLKTQNRAVRFGGRGGEDREEDGGARAERRWHQGWDEKRRRRRIKGLGTRRCLDRLRNGNIMRIQWPRFIGLPPLHPLSKLGMWVVKWIRLDEPYESMVSDHSSDHWFKKSTFGQLPNLPWLEIKKNLNSWDITLVDAR